MVLEKREPPSAAAEKIGDSGQSKRGGRIIAGKKNVIGTWGVMSPPLARMIHAEPRKTRKFTEGIALRDDAD